MCLETVQLQGNVGMVQCVCVCERERERERKTERERERGSERDRYRTLSPVVYVCPGHKSNPYLNVVTGCNGILLANGALQFCMCVHMC